jgi:hypothetical protein
MGVDYTAVLPRKLSERSSRSLDVIVQTGATVAGRLEF